jgi:hypothetical protein
MLHRQRLPVSQVLLLLLKLYCLGLPPSSCCMCHIAIYVMRLLYTVSVQELHFAHVQQVASRSCMGPFWRQYLKLIISDERYE